MQASRELCKLEIHNSSNRGFNNYQKTIQYLKMTIYETALINSDVYRKEELMPKE